MALGYCTECDKLTPLRPGSQGWGTRQVDWYPVTHEALTHPGCSIHLGMPDHFSEPVVCPLHGPVRVISLMLSRCEGHKKAVR